MQHVGIDGHVGVLRMKTVVLWDLSRYNKAESAKDAGNMPLGERKEGVVLWALIFLRSLD